MWFLVKKINYFNNYIYINLFIQINVHLILYLFYLIKPPHVLLYVFCSTNTVFIS